MKTMELYDRDAYSRLEPKEFESVLKIGQHDSIVSYEYEKDFIRFRFTDGRSLKFTVEDVGRDMLEEMKSRISHTRYFASFLRKTKSLASIIDRCWETKRC